MIEAWTEAIRDACARHSARLRTKEHGIHGRHCDLLGALVYSDDRTGRITTDDVIAALVALGGNASDALSFVCGAGLGFDGIEHGHDGEAYCASGNKLGFEIRQLYIRTPWPSTTT